MKVNYQPKTIRYEARPRRAVRSNLTDRQAAELWQMPIERIQHYTREGWIHVYRNVNDRWVLERDFCFEEIYQTYGYRLSWQGYAYLANPQVYPSFPGRE
jgi:hypothetical protein